MTMTIQELRDKWLDEPQGKQRFKYYAEWRAAEGRPVSWATRILMKFKLL